MFSLFSSPPLPAGVTAPLFTCSDDHGQEFTLSEQRGRKVVLVFYPADNTPTCTKQLCELRDNHSRLAEKGAAVYGVNPGSEASHSAFRSKHGFPFPILVDAGKEVAKLYRCAGLIVKRTVYVIDEEGVIRYSRRGKPPVDEILAAM